LRSWRELDVVSLSPTTTMSKAQLASRTQFDVLSVESGEESEEEQIENLEHAPPPQPYVQSSTTPYLTAYY